MPTRTLNIGGKAWRVFPSGRVTQYDHDEFALMFVAGSGDDRDVRVTRYSPLGTRSRYAPGEQCCSSGYRQISWIRELCPDNNPKAVPHNFSQLLAS